MANAIGQKLKRMHIREIQCPVPNNFDHYGSLYCYINDHPNQTQSNPYNTITKPKITIQDKVNHENQVIHFLELETLGINNQNNHSIHQNQKPNTHSVHSRIKTRPPQLLLFSPNQSERKTASPLKLIQQKIDEDTHKLTQPNLYDQTIQRLYDKFSKLDQLPVNSLPEVDVPYEANLLKSFPIKKNGFFQQQESESKLQKEKKEKRRHLILMKMMDSTRIPKQNQFDFSVNKWLNCHKKQKQGTERKSVTSPEFGIESINIMKQIVDSRKLKQRDNLHNILNQIEHNLNEVPL